jgi:hypothetical protein
MKLSTLVWIFLLRCKTCEKPTSDPITNWKRLTQVPTLYFLLLMFQPRGQPPPPSASRIGWGCVRPRSWRGGRPTWRPRAKSSALQKVTRRNCFSSFSTKQHRAVFKRVYMPVGKINASAWTPLKNCPVQGPVQGWNIFYMQIKCLKS